MLPRQAYLAQPWSNHEKPIFLHRCGNEQKSIEEVLKKLNDAKVTFRQTKNAGKVSHLERRGSYISLHTKRLIKLVLAVTCPARLITRIKLFINSLVR